jgi:methyl-accepting chemotaxis protein
MNGNLLEIVQQVRSGTDTIADLSSRTEEQASALELTVSAMEELSSTVPRLLA